MTALFAAFLCIGALFGLPGLSAATFPSVTGAQTGASTTSPTTHTITLPTGIVANDILLVEFDNDGSATASVTTPASGWTELFNTVNGTATRLTVFWRRADGLEAATITVTTSSGEGSAWTAYKITGAHTTTALEAGTATTGTSVNPDSPLLDPVGWATEDTLWFSVYGWDVGSTSNTTFPASYTRGKLTDRWNNTTNGTGVASAGQYVAAASADPGQAVISVSRAWVANTIAIRPAVATGGDPAAFVAGQSETYYVRPTGACSFSGDGSAYACAASAGAAGAWIGVDQIKWQATDGVVGQLDPNDTVFVCGTHFVTATITTRVTPTADGGLDGQLIIDGACPNDPGTLDGQEVGVRLVNLEPWRYITVQNLTLTNTGLNDYTISGFWPGSDVTQTRHITIHNNQFLNNILTQAVVWLYGGEFTVTDNLFDVTGDDAIHVEGGKDLTVTGNTCRRISHRLASGDCLQINVAAQADQGTTIINDNDCEKDINVKYCILADDRSGRTEIIGNRAVCLTGPTLDPNGCNPILTGGVVGQTQQLIVRGNYVSGGWRGITVFDADNAAVPAQIVSNVVKDAGTLGIWLNANVDHAYVVNNVMLTNGLLDDSGGRHAIYIGKPASTTTFVLNNVFSQNRRGLFFITSIAGRTTNDFIGQTSWDIDNNGTQGSLDASDLTVDPLFVLSGYRTQGNSPLRRVGTVWSNACVDFRGRRCWVSPDIGAYQATSGDPASTRTVRVP